MGLSVTASWTPPAGVVAQTLTLHVNGAAQAPVPLGPTVASHTFDVQPGDSVSVSLTCTDGTLTSEPATASLSVPHPPAAPSGLALAVSQH